MKEEKIYLVENKMDQNTTEAPKIFNVKTKKHFDQLFCKLQSICFESSEKNGFINEMPIYDD